LARGIVLTLENQNALNNDFNLSTAKGHTVLELAKIIWHKIHGASRPFNFTSEDGFEHDVQKRVPSTQKAEEVLGFSADTDLEDMLDEVIPWIRNARKEGLI
jgi:nucleoside-diphosphate-sugar epimerase